MHHVWIQMQDRTFFTEKCDFLAKNQSVNFIFFFQVLAINRGEALKILSVKIKLPDDWLKELFHLFWELSRRGVLNNRSYFFIYWKTITSGYKGYLKICEQSLVKNRIHEKARTIWMSGRKAGPPPRIKIINNAIQVELDLLLVLIL